jgi:hypothetical protein
MSLKIKLVENNQIIQKKINKAFADELNKSLSKSVPKIEARIAPLIRSALNASPEITSLRSGILKLEFGLEDDPTPAIIQAIVDSIQVRFQKIDPKTFAGGFTLVMQPSNFANLLSLSAASQPIDNGSLPWLSWLLTAGDSVIIANFGVEFGGFPKSRTGGARMAQKAAPYKVNSAFSGTEDDNFITRSIERVSAEIRRIVKGVL